MTIRQTLCSRRQPSPHSRRAFLAQCGGGFGLLNANTNMGGASNTAFEFEPGAQARVFVTQNVAISGRVGIVLTFGYRVGPLQQQLAFQGQTLGGGGGGALFNFGFGFTYYFR